MKVLTLLLFVMGISIAAGCTSQPTLNVSDDAQRSFDGLYPFNNPRVGQAWARADVDLSDYTNIKLEGAGIRYRKTSPNAGNRFAARSRETEFPLNAEARERLQKTLADAFLAELSALEGYEITQSEGPDVLLVKGMLLDVVSKVPPEPVGMVDIYLESVGEATLVLELIDSETNSVLVRAADRRDAGSSGTMSMPSNPVTNWIEVERVAQMWARMLSKRLSEVSKAIAQTN